MIRLPQSHRKRMRLLRAAILGAVLLGLALLLAFVRNTGHSYATATVDKPAMRFHEPKHVPSTAQERRAALKTLDPFVRSALVRRNLEASWPLATRHMRVGVTHAEWLEGTLPIAPYTSAFRTARYQLRYSYRDALGFGVLLIPRTVHDDEGAYLCEVQRLRGKWLVDFCYSEATPSGRYANVTNTGLAP